MTASTEARPTTPVSRRAPIVACVAGSYGPTVYSVCGIVQSCIGGKWHEVTVLERVRGARYGGGAAAAAFILELHARRNRETDPLAITRWYNPPKVRFEQEDAYAARA